MRILRNFVFDICGCAKDWNAGQRIALIEDQIRERAGDRNIFFFVSGGVDSTVAFMLCLRCPRLRTRARRLCRYRTDARRRNRFRSRNLRRASAWCVSKTAPKSSSEPSNRRREPELKRHIIGEQFVRVQERIIEERGLLDGGWILGQGTIYPDTIESGGTAKAATIKTHHNRVPGIQKLIESGRIVEPLADFYKDEVRAIGRELGLAPRTCSNGILSPARASPFAASARIPMSRSPASPDGYLVPVRSVGVQGDSRSYAPVLAIDAFPSAAARLQDEATELVNRSAGVNRVIARVAAREALEHQHVFVEHHHARPRRTAARGRRHRARTCAHESGFDKAGLAISRNSDSARAQGNPGIPSCCVPFSRLTA